MPGAKQDYIKKGLISMKHSLKIYGTFGPSCHSKPVLKQMLMEGMTGIRLNLSHSNLEGCREWIENLRAVSNEMHLIPDLLIDLKGPELRIGDLPFPILLNPGDKVRLSSRSCKGETLLIPIPETAVPYLGKDREIRLDDGRITLRCLNSEGESVVITGGLLSSRKSLAINGETTSLPTLQKEDLKNLDLIPTYGVTEVMLPFVRHKKDLLCLREALLTRGLTRIRILAKIENAEGLARLSELLPYCDEIVIARGDLGNNLPLSKLPAIQKHIARLCRLSKTPFMVVTQLLTSMEHAPVPTRAEVSDIFNAVLDGASSLMLTGETAVGNYPAESVKMLSETALEGLRYLSYNTTPVL